LRHTKKRLNGALACHLQSHNHSAGLVNDEGALRSSFNVRYVSIITFGGIIDVGLFVGSTTAIGNIGPAAVLTYALVGFLVLLVMLMITEMAMAIQGKQTFLDFERQVVDDWVGFMVGRVYWYFWMLLIAIEAIASAKIILDWYPQLEV
jgi:GABA permease